MALIDCRDEMTETEARPIEPAVLEQRTTQGWIAAIGEEFPCGPVLSLDEVFADPQVERLNLTRTVYDAELGDVPILRLPITFSATPAAIRSGRPQRAAHTRPILVELGYTEAEIERLLVTGAVSAEDR